MPTNKWGELREQMSPERRAAVEARAAAELARIADACPTCHGVRWVCEVHPDEPLEHDQCGGAGMLCPACNRSDPPEMPPDLRQRAEGLVIGRKLHDQPHTLQFHRFKIGS